MKKILIGLSAIAVCYSGLSLGQEGSTGTTSGGGAGASGTKIGAVAITGYSVAQVKGAAINTGLDNDTAETIGEGAADLGAPTGSESPTTDAANGGSTVAAVTTSTEQGPSGLSG